MGLTLVKIAKLTVWLVTRALIAIVASLHFILMEAHAFHVQELVINAIIRLIANHVLQDIIKKQEFVNRVK